MPEAPLLPQSPLQRQIAQLALDYAAKLEQAAEQAPLGCVVAACEALILDQGRQLLRDSLAATLQHRIDQGEKKGAPPAPVPAVSAVATRGRGHATSSPPSGPSA